MKYHCPKCGGVKWRTRVKRQCWQCRNCKYIKGFYEIGIITKNPTAEPVVLPKPIVKPKPLIEEKIMPEVKPKQGIWEKIKNAFRFQYLPFRRQK